MIKSFHQFVHIEKGSVNSAIIDFLKGDVYHTENEIIRTFLERECQKIPKFVQLLQKEGLIIEHDEKRWIPRLEFKIHELNKYNYELEIEQGVNLKNVLEFIVKTEITRMTVYGNSDYGKMIQGVKINYKQKSFNKCLNMSTINGVFGKISETEYNINKIYNSCWGRKIAITRDGMIRPCIYSEIVIGDMLKEDIDAIIQKANEYWNITKDKVEICKDCEFRYLCFDCREIAYREFNNIFAPNPNCFYNPYSGKFR